MSGQPLHVAVIGAGVVGASTALWLLRDGHRVTLIDPAEPGGEAMASYGNIGWLSDHSIIPVSLPGHWRQAPEMLLDPLGPLAIRWGYLPRLMPWLLRFMRAGRLAEVERIARALTPLLGAGYPAHVELAREAGVPQLLHRVGGMYVYRDRAAYERDALVWRIRRDNGIRLFELDEDELRQREPDLNRDYRFAVYMEQGGHCGDPGGLVAAYVATAQAAGARLLPARAIGFSWQGETLAAVETEAGLVPCDRVVLAAGAHGKALARALGDAVPLDTERGYHWFYQDAEAGPRTPMIVADAKCAITRMDWGLRIGGTVEFGGLDAPPNWERARLMQRHAQRIFPGLPREIDPARVKLWMGFRPSMPDSLPVLGFARRSRQAVHAFGHGHIGLAAGASTGKAVADLFAGRPPAFDIAAFSAQRFG